MQALALPSKLRIAVKSCCATLLQHLAQLQCEPDSADDSTGGSVHIGFCTDWSLLAERASPFTLSSTLAACAWR
jgi:hypothetical protein